MKTATILTIAIAFFFGGGSNSGHTAGINPANDTITVYTNTTLAMMSNSIPDSVFLMKGLKQLSITGMDCDYIELDGNGKNVTRCWAINQIPAQIKNLAKLEKLSLPVNNISALPPEIKELKQLRMIDLTDNSAFNAASLDNLPENIEEVYLFGCGISKLPDAFYQLKHLKKLGLAGNNFSPGEKMRIKKTFVACEIVL